MAKLDLLMKALDMGYWEMSEAFKGLPDEDVWKRADPRLLSVGELAAHIALGEAKTFLGDTVSSPLFLEQAQYYSHNAPDPFTLDLGADALFAEVMRIHEACKAVFNDLNPDSEGQNPYRTEWTWGVAVEYMVFHVAYHTGQIYSVRHLLGHEPVDN